MKSYCVKQRKQTECVPGSETFLKTRNGRKAMRCQCAECGITKFRFVKGTKGKVTKTRSVKGTKGKGLLLGKNSPFRNIPVLGAIL